MKKSGLADSPFFTKPTPLSPVTEQVIIHDEQTPQSQNVFTRADEQTHKRTDAQMHERANVQTHKRTDAQTHIRSNAQQKIEPLNLVDRPTTRESFDIYTDQLEAFEQLRLRLKKERGRHIRKGELMRELLDQILLKK